jgi:hypothetical protein
MGEEQHGHVHMLEAMLAEHERALNDAFAIVNREEPIVASLKAAILALTGTVTAKPIASASGNGAGLPPKKLEYREMALIPAMQRALGKIASSGYAHVNDIVAEIYTPIADKDMFVRVKRNCVSELIRASRKGLFVRGDAKNSFGLPIDQKRNAA